MWELLTCSFASSLMKFEAQTVSGLSGEATLASGQILLQNGVGNPTQEPAVGLTGCWNHFNIALCNFQREVRVESYRDEQAQLSFNALCCTLSVLTGKTKTKVLRWHDWSIERFLMWVPRFNVTAVKCSHKLRSACSLRFQWRPIFPSWTLHCSLFSASLCMLLAIDALGSKFPFQVLILASVHPYLDFPTRCP